MFVSPEGEALSNYISWQDRRLLEPHPSGLGSFYDAFSARLSPDDWRDLGREIRPGTPLSYLFWMAENKETAPCRVFRGHAARFCPVQTLRHRSRHPPEQCSWGH